MPDGFCFVSVCRYGDMRVMMTYELFSMWQNLGEIFSLYLHKHLPLHTAGEQMMMKHLKAGCKLPIKTREEKEKRL